MAMDNYNMMDATSRAWKDYTPWERLACAIVIQAAADYREAAAAFRRGKNAAASTMQEISNFFHSEWCQKLIPNTDPIALWERLVKEYGAPPMEGAFIAHRSKRGPAGIPIRCIETGTVYGSVHNAIVSVGVNSTAGLLRALNNPRYTYAGCHWERVRQKGGEGR